MANTAIKVDQVSKDFSLPSERMTSLKSRVVHPFKKVHYKTQHALKGINLEIKEGEFFGIVGRNGSGKSTLLKLLAGIYQPTKGTISVHGKLVPFIELGVGFNPELTGRENVFLNGALLGFSEKEVAQMYDDIVEFAELGEFMEQKLKNYSSGMQVRLAFSMAIKARADILLIDEVLAVGDADFQRKCYEYFNELKNKKKTVVFISHDMGAIQQYCDRVALIDENELKKIGKPEIVTSLYHRLFVKDIVKPRSSKKPHESVSGEERWGDGKAKFTKVEINKSKNSKKILIRAVARATEDIENAIVGFSIKNEVLTQILGTNTARKKHKVGYIKAGETVEINWEVDDVFNEGRHYVDITFAHDTASLVSDRWPEAGTFFAYRENSTPYLVNTPVSVKTRIINREITKELHDQKQG